MVTQDRAFITVEQRLMNSFLREKKEIPANPKKNSSGHISEGSFEENSGVKLSNYNLYEN